jgi:aryl carrier-like protein
MRKTPSIETPAYIIFTSGSTGKPKGTLITHANLAAFCQNFIKLANLKTSTRTLQFASIGFDASILEIFPTLSVGAMVIFPTQDQRRSSQLLLKLLEEEQISLALIPPSLLAILPYQQLPHLRTLLVGGEASSKDLQERWRKGRTLINAYGPTENTVMATSMVMEHNTPHNNIGYPLDGVLCLVLDDRLRQLPNYAIGEFCIGGKQLSAGYINNSEQNQEHFINHPIWGRLYRSGDKVMRTDDGSFIFLGRIDSQVKIRGFRVELSEITRNIESIPGIHQAHVIMEGSNRRARLIAYCVKDEGTDISEQDICDQLSSWLPQYMIPAAIVFMDSFPLTINNKIDVAQLPKPTISSQYVAPVPGAEQQIADIVCQLLGKDQISVTTNLFYEGLTSILAMDLVWKMTQAGLTYSYSDIYKHKSIRQLVVNGLSRAWHWHNAETDKPIAVLVCGYTPMSPFYDEFIEKLSQSYSVLVFDSFATYYAAHPDQPCKAENYTDFMCEVVLAEMKKRGTTVSVITGHSIGSELGILLAGQIRKRHHPDVKVVALGTSLAKMPDLAKYLNNHHNILRQMEETMPSLEFDGELKVVLENRPSPSLLLNGDRDPQFLKESKAAVEKNLDAWKEKYPQATKLILDTDHFGILQSEFIDDIIALF